MFENLSEKLQRTFKNLRGEGKLTEENVNEALREIRLALLEADVNVKVVKQLLDTVKEKALGSEVMTALSPGEQMVKVVRDELVAILGQDTAKIKFASQPPSVVLMAGLQGSGKTTTSGKLAGWFKKGGHRPMLVSVDVYPPPRASSSKSLPTRSRRTSTKASPTQSRTPRRSSGWLRKRAAKPSTTDATCSSLTLPAACTSTIS